MPAAMLPAADPQSFTATAEHAARLLLAGELVGVPTETVYGIAVDLRHPAAFQRLRKLKKITGNPGWVIHVAGPEDIQKLITGLSAVATRIIQKGWPGPIALQVPLSPEQHAQLQQQLGDTLQECLVDQRLTLRCPDVPVTQEIIDLVNGPVAIVGAAGADNAPVFDAASFPSELSTHLAAIVDGGTTRYRKASTLVRVENNKAQVIRAGVIDARIIYRLAEFVILFVCSGNTCRSPMAAGLAAKYLADRLKIKANQLPGHNIQVLSAGLHAQRGMHATPEAVQAAADLGAEIDDHSSQSVTLELLHRADLIYTMTEAHRQHILEMWPAAARRTMRLDPRGDVADPVGGDADLYRQVAERLARLIDKALSGISP